MSDDRELSPEEFAARLRPEAIDAWRAEHGLPPIDRTLALPIRDECGAYCRPPTADTRPLGVGPHC